MNNTQISHFIFQGADGRDAFFIRLEFEPELNEYFLGTSFIIDLNKYFKYDSMAGDVTCMKRKEDMIPKINKMAKVILNIPELRQYYLPEFLLNKEGRFSLETANTLLQMIDGKTMFPDYTLFSEQSNPIFYHDFRMALITSVVNSEPGQIPRSRWEELIASHQDIQQEYVEYYSDSNHFNYAQGKDRFGNPVDYFMLFEDNKLKFFFTRRTPQ
jgi:hypothetical protein